MAVGQCGRSGRGSDQAFDWSLERGVGGGRKGRGVGMEEVMVEEWFRLLSSRGGARVLAHSAAAASFRRL